MYLGSPSSPVDEKDRLRAETPLFESSKKPMRRNEDLVYFNSNRYLGERYLSHDAIHAGYRLGGDRPLPGESILEFTEKKLLERDADEMILQAESRLLHALAKFPKARTAMRTVYSASTFGPASMHWTRKEREWLFLCLSGSPEIHPPLPLELLDGGTPFQLHSHLANRADCPENAFGKDIVCSFTNKNGCPNSYTTFSTVNGTNNRVDSSVGRHSDFDADDSNTNSFENSIPYMERMDSEEEESDSVQKTPLEADPILTETKIRTSKTSKCSRHVMGCLDEYFLAAEDVFPSFCKSRIAQETRAELTVQETVASLLRATAMKRFYSAKSKLSMIVLEMDHRENLVRYKPSDNVLSRVSLEKLQELFTKIGSEVIDAQKSLYEADRSCDRVNSHLLDYSISNGVQYKMSQAEIERLDKVMEEHVASLPEDTHRPTTPGGDGTYVFGTDEYDDNIDSNYGGRNPKEYVTRGLPNGEISWC